MSVIDDDGEAGRGDGPPAVVLSGQACVGLGAVQPPVFAVLVPLVAMRDAPDSVRAQVGGVPAATAPGAGRGSSRSGRPCHDA